MPRWIILLFIATISFNSYSQSATLLFAIDVIRHGDRTPISQLPSTPYEWPQGLGQLTPKGMQQEYNLGVAMRKRYIIENHLLPPKYDVNTFYARSTNVDRTLMSAQSLLSGLYPLGTGPLNALPKAQQPIPIHTVPKRQDTLLLVDSSAKKNKELLKKYVFSRADWQQKTTELSPYFARWSKLTGVKIAHLHQLISIADALYIRGLYHLPLPKGMTQQEASTIISAGQWAFVTEFSPYPIGEATGHRLLSTIAAQLSSAAEKKMPLKAILYSAHDSTILSLMSAMHAPLKQPPPYASDVSFRLLKVGTEFHIEISLNNKRIKVPACQAYRCQLSEFAKINEVRKSIDSDPIGFQKNKDKN